MDEETGWVEYDPSSERDFDQPAARSTYRVHWAVWQLWHEDIHWYVSYVLTGKYTRTFSFKKVNAKLKSPINRYMENRKVDLSALIK